MWLTAMIDIQKKLKEFDQGQTVVMLNDINLQEINKKIVMEKIIFLSNNHKECLSNCIRYKHFNDELISILVSITYVLKQKLNFFNKRNIISLHSCIYTGAINITTSHNDRLFISGAR